jgi:hypothetical protein
MQTDFIIFRRITDVCVFSDQRPAVVDHRIGI